LVLALRCGSAAVAFLNGMHNMRLDMLPWTGMALSWWVLGLGLAGVIVTALAVTGVLRVLFLVWTVAVLGLMVRGYFFSPYRFDGWDGFCLILLFVFGALLAVAGGWIQFRDAPAKARRA
jgi:hypothetical protein